MKVPTAFAYIVAITLTREGDWPALVLLVSPLLVGAWWSRLGVWLVLRRTFIALPFALAAVPLIFTRPGETIFTMPLVGWSASHEGAVAVVTILARSWIAVGVGVLLVSTTPVTEILRALRVFRVPKILVATIFFAYRYFFVIGEEAQRMLRARDSRSAALPGRRPGGSLRWRASIVGHMVGSLFLRSLERSERVYAAMQARGYRGEQRFLDAPPLPWAAALPGLLIIGYGFAVQAALRLA